jgi:spore coat polysaccharide biosynthesis protein SpsF
MKTIGIIQARTGSTRLPGKMMYPLAGETVLSRVIARSRLADEIDDVIIATTTNDQDDVIAAEASAHGASVSRGSEADVLDRIHDAAAAADADIVVRICGDNPLLSPVCVDAVVSHLRDAGGDYASFATPNDLPRGVTAEAFTMESFSCVHDRAKGSDAREHVTLWYLEHDETYAVVSVPVSAAFPAAARVRGADIRLTLDEPADYELLADLYEHFQDATVELASVVEYVEETGIAETNAHVAQRNPRGDTDV